MARHPLPAAIAQGKMPVMIEMHLTEGDQTGFQQLRSRYLRDAAMLPDLSVLGQFVRQVDAADEDLTANERRLVKKLQMYADFLSSGKVDFVAMDDGARGVIALDNTVAAELLVGLGADPARLMANLVARNRHAVQIRGRLRHLADIGVRTALLLTGDLPADTDQRAVYPLDSIGMCELARGMLIDGSLPDDFLIAASGHPNPDADPDGLRTLHKVLAGARVIVTQAIFSLPAFEAWIDELRRQGVLDRVDLLAEVIPITSTRQLGMLADIPGMRIPEELALEFAALEDRLSTAASAGGHDERWFAEQRGREGMRLTRELLHRIRKVAGVSGFYLGCVNSVEAQNALLKETPLLPVHAGAPAGAAKLSGADRQHVLAQKPAVEKVLSGIVQKARRRHGGALRSVLKRAARRRTFERTLKVIEWPKVPIFGCKGCDQCDLSFDGLVCPRSCAKQMTHGPCGAPRLVDGRYLCEDTARECTWAKIRSRRDLYGIALHARLSSRTAPSPPFFAGQRLSAIAPVLRGEKESPFWSLAYRAPLSHLRSLWHRSDACFRERNGVVDLTTRIASRSEQLIDMLRAKPDMDSEELLIKALVLEGSPQALHLIESLLVELGLPAEGSLADLSIREQIRLAGAVPAIRKRVKAPREAESQSGSPSHLDEIMTVVDEGKQLRRALRRERVNALIRHVGMLGVRVSYAETLLAQAHVAAFLEALTVLKDELQIARSRLTERFGWFSVHFNRIHYSHHYRAPIALRSFNGDAVEDWHQEIVIDMRQFDMVESFRVNLRRTIENLIAGRSESDGAVVLEDFVPESRSVAWSFNRAFWMRLREFERATGVDYDESIGGSTDRNAAYVRSTARAFVDRLKAHSEENGPYYVVEVGVASPHRARMFLDEVERISDLHRSHVYGRTVYVMADYSDVILRSSADTLRKDHANVESVKIEASDPQRALERFRGRIQHVHICNVYDNLPTDKIAWIDEQLYRIESRLYIDKTRLDGLLGKHDLDGADGDGLCRRLRALGDDGDGGVSGLLDWVRDRLLQNGRDELAYVAFWMDLFNGLCAQERYVRVDRDDDRALDPIAGLHDAVELLEKHFTGQHNTRVHLNQAALNGFVRMLELLHPLGTLEVVDLFVQRLEEYQSRFKGPAKYDGSTVNWLNGPLFRAVGEQLGYHVRFHSFRPYDPKSASVIMLVSRQRADTATDFEE